MFMSTTTIRKILATRPLHRVGPDTTLPDIARLMAEHHVGAVVVMQDVRLVGIVSERDIVFRAVAGDMPVDTTTAEEIMTRDPVTVDVDAPISEALEARLGIEFRHLPVIEDGNVAGLLSYRDIPAEYLMLFERFREMSSARADEYP
ncbi:CBS domain-containing protein [Rhodovulum iodosum]|uniref:CBS domain-containing protein n=1 Tax=Rhodovulum iodosum TaxID=68291 RepID=A0ABV3XUB9_9RHOB